VGDLLSDLAKLAALLELQERGYFEVQSALGVERIAAERVSALLPVLGELTWVHEPAVNAVPLVKPGEYLARVPSRLIWARTRSGRAAELLRRFRPRPSLVLRDGATVRYTAFWALEEPLRFDHVERANKRLAKHLNAGGYDDAAIGFTFFLPGTMVRLGRRSTLPIQLAYCELRTCTAREVVGKLKDPPTDEEKRAIFDRHLERQKSNTKRAVPAPDRASFAVEKTEDPQEGLF
jgi:hypothetical protein